MKKKPSNAVAEMMKIYSETMLLSERRRVLFWLERWMDEASGLSLHDLRVKIMTGTEVDED